MIITGDIHANLNAIGFVTALALRLQEDTIIQVGDWGGHWPGNERKVQKHFDKKRERPTWLTCLGNHDNYDKLAELGPPIEGWTKLHNDVYAAERPTIKVVSNQTLCFFGGAESTDAHHRTPGKSWWKQESPTATEFEALVEHIEMFKPDIMITHDAPLNHRPPRTGVCTLSGLPTTYTSEQLQNVYNVCSHKPRLWFYGHHHHLTMSSNDNTDFLCCGIEGEGYIMVEKEDDFAIMPFGIKRDKVRDVVARVKAELSS
jgi:Icc-related predicted phosphoesterase